jgi:hypothetical protein
MISLRSWNELSPKARCTSDVAAEQGDAPAEALVLKILNDVLSVIKVRLAGDPGC